MRLTVLYDPRCSACRRFARFLGWEQQLVPLELLSSRAPRTQSQYPRLHDAGAAHHRLTAVSDRGEVWQGANAWRMSLWALVRHRLDARRTVEFLPPRFDGDHPAGALSATTPAGASGVAGLGMALLGTLASLVGMLLLISAAVLALVWLVSRLSG